MDQAESSAEFVRINLIPYRSRCIFLKIIVFELLENFNRTALREGGNDGIENELVVLAIDDEDRRPNINGIA